MKFFDVAPTPKFMQDLGLHGDKFTIRYGVIARHVGKDNEHTLPQEIWARLPQAIQNPFAITKYYADEKKEKQKGYRLYTSLKLDNGSYVVVSVEVKNSGKDIEVNAINTIFARQSISETHDELIYTSKEITPEQSALLNRNNPYQYPTEQELSTDKGSENSQDNKENLQKNAEADKQQEKQKEALATNHEKIEQAKEFTIEPAQYTTKKGKVLDMYLVKFSADLSSAVRSSAITLTKELRGWWDKRQGGFMMRSKDDAEQLAKFVTDAHMQSSLSMSDIQAVNDGAVQFSEPISDTSNKEKQNKEYTPVWQYYVSVDEKTGYTILERDDVSGPIPIGDVSFYHYANSPEEMFEILQNPLNGMQDVLDAVRVKLENKIAFRKIKANGHNGYKIGDKVIYKGKQAEIHDFEDYGEYLPVLATGLEPMLYEVANWDEIKKIHSNNREKEETSSKNNGNRLVTDERYEELKERLRKKLYGQMNMGIDPEILTIGVEMAVYHIEKGARKFSEYAKVMIADMGDAVRPYLKAFYNTLRDISEEKKDGMSDLMTPYDEVKAFDIENFDKENINLRATAENNDTPVRDK